MLKKALSAVLVAAVATTSSATPIWAGSAEYVMNCVVSASSSIASMKSAPTSVPTPSPSELTALREALILAGSHQNRQAILTPNPPDASNMTYQFVNNSVKAPTGGTVGLASVNNFPALIGTNVGFAVGFINPCGLNVPHLHPRADEFLVVTQGELVGGLVLEVNTGSNGDINGTNPMGPIPIVNATLSNYKGMLFPMGLVHFQFNPTCEPAVFTAGFDNSDPGRTQLAQNFFSVEPDEVLLAATGNNLEYLDANQLDHLRGKIPHAFAELMGSCAQKCGIATS